jgi:hypothetical protein
MCTYIYVHIFLSWEIVGGEWSASRSGRYIPGERAPCTHRKGGWVGPRASLDNTEKRKFLTIPGLELQHIIIQTIANCYPVSLTAAYINKYDNTRSNSLPGLEINEFNCFLSSVLWILTCFYCYFLKFYQLLTLYGSE